MTFSVRNPDPHYDIPAAHQYYRLQRLQRMYDDAVMKGERLIQKLALEQLRREMISRTARKVIFIAHRFYSEMSTEALKEEIRLMEAELKKRGVNPTPESEGLA